jgi:hypothetical protein
LPLRDRFCGFSPGPDTRFWGNRPLADGEGFDNSAVSAEKLPKRGAAYAQSDAPDSAARQLRRLARAWQFLSEKQRSEVMAIVEGAQPGTADAAIRQKPR